MYIMSAYICTCILCVDIYTTHLFQVAGFKSRIKDQCNIVVVLWYIARFQFRSILGVRACSTWHKPLVPFRATRVHDLPDSLVLLRSRFCAWRPPRRPVLANPTHCHPCSSATKARPTCDCCCLGSWTCRALLGCKVKRFRLRLREMR